MAEAQQGHLYKHGDMRVLAMTSGQRVTCREVLDGVPWMGPAYHALAEWLQPLPMRYFGGQVPRG